MTRRRVRSAKGVGFEVLEERKLLSTGCWITADAAETLDGWCAAAGAIVPAADSLLSQNQPPTVAAGSDQTVLADPGNGSIVDIPAVGEPNDPFIVGPGLGTDPVGGGSADDPAIWIHPDDPGQSLIIGTAKDAGMYVYDLAGREIQHIADGKLNNVDVRYGFDLNGETVDLVTVSNRTIDTIDAYQVDRANRRLVKVGTIETGISVYGYTSAHDLQTGKYYGIVSSEGGKIEQYELHQGGPFSGTLVRSFDAGGTVEGIVSDDALGNLFLAEEDGGLYKYGLDPATGTERIEIDNILGRLHSDIEGLTIYYGKDGTGYLIASAQGVNAFVVYAREAAHAYLTTFEVRGVANTDGIDLTNVALGSAFPMGVFVAQNDDRDFQLVAWEEIAEAGNLSIYTGRLGGDPAATVAATALDGTVADDGLPNPPGVTTTGWTQVSGPGTVTFADPSAVDTTAGFSALGTYVLRLEASDGQYTAGDEVVITVEGPVGGPTISEIADQETSEDTVAGPIWFAVGDADTPAESLVATASADNASLIPGASLVLAGSGTNRSITLYPAANQSGMATVTVTVSDGTASASDTFLLTVTAENDPPTPANPIPDQWTNEGETFRFTFALETFHDADAGDWLSYTASRADGSPLPPWLSFDASTRTFNGTPDDQDVATLTVRVTAVDSSSEAVSDEFVIEVVNVNETPLALTGGPYWIDLDEDLVLDGSASFDPDEPSGDSIVSYQWDLLGDGSYEYAGAIVTVPWADLAGLPQPGAVIPVRLRVTDHHGLASIAEAELRIFDNRPVAVLAATPNPAACDQAVSFDASGSAHGRPDRSVVQYEWDFDYDGTNIDVDVAGVTASHAYTHFGQYTAALRVTDDNVPAKTEVVTVIIDVSLGNRAPVADAGGPYWLDVGSDLELDGAGSWDPDVAWGDSIVGYAWDLRGDGSFEYSGSQVMVPWADLAGLPQPGVATALTLRVTDSFGATHETTAELTLFDNRPVAVLAASPNPAACDQAVSFDASGSTHGRPDRSIVRYEWDFDYDGTNLDVDAAGVTASHAYTHFGQYTAALRVTDDNVPAKTEVATVIIDVSLGNRAPVADPGDSYQVPYGRNLLLDGSDSYDPDAGWGDAIVSYRWDLGDDGQWDYTGVQAEAAWEDLAGLALGMPVAVRLEVTDGFGLVDSRAAELTVLPPAPLGTIDFRRLPSQDLSAGGLWYQFTAGYDARLTLEASRQDVELILWDQSFGRLQTSEPVEGRQRLDRPASAGETFYVQLSGEGGEVDLRIVNLLGHQGTNVTVRGTAERDEFAFDASAPARQVMVQGIAYEFTVAQADTFLFDGLDGNDTVQVAGSGGDDVATLRPSTALVRGNGYTVAAVNVESSTFDGGGGEDVARLYGSRRADHFTFGGNETAYRAAFTGGVALTATAEKVYGHGSGGSDTAELRKPAETDPFEPFWRRVQISAEGHAGRVSGLRSVVVRESESSEPAGMLAPEDDSAPPLAAGVERAVLIDAVVGETTEERSGISLDDLARLFRLSEYEKPTKTSPERASEAGQFDWIFAYWE